MNNLTSSSGTPAHMYKSKGLSSSAAIIKALSSESIQNTSKYLNLNVSVSVRLMQQQLVNVLYQHTVFFLIFNKSIVLFSPFVILYVVYVVKVPKETHTLIFQFINFSVDASLH